MKRALPQTKPHASRITPHVSRLTLYAILALGVLAVSTAALFIRMAQAEVSSLAIAAWRLTLASLILAPVTLATRRAELRQLTRKEWALALGAGLFLAAHFAAWISSLALTSVAASVVLVTTNPLWIALFSHLLLHERLTRPTMVGLVVALVGSAIIGLGDASKGAHQLLGDGLALAGALAVAGYMLIGRRLRARLSLLGYIFPVYATAAVALMAAAILTRAPLTGYSPRAWLWLLLLAIIPQIIGHSSFNFALRHVTATTVALAVLVEPIGSTLLAWLFLSEPPTLAAVFGGLLILGGLQIASGLQIANRRSQIADCEPASPQIGE